MAKKSRSKNYKKVLAIDLGGTKLAAAVIDSEGKILSEVREKVNLGQGAQGLIAQMVALVSPLLKQHKVLRAGLASAGPLDPVQGVLLNPTNLKSNGKMWGKVHIVRELEKKIKIKVALENDAAAAVLAESWMGQGGKSQNLIAVTLGTGLGVGVITNGELVRAGRNLHPEIGHITMDYHDRLHPCGCGNYGCAESFLSGTNFIERLKKKWGEPSLTGELILKRAHGGDADAQMEFLQYGEQLAYFIYSLVVMFCPEKIILSGGFSHAGPFFLEAAKTKLAELLKTRRAGHDLLPKILISRFQDEVGLTGAAYVAFRMGSYSSSGLRILNQ